MTNSLPRRPISAQAKAAVYHIAILTTHEVPDYLQSDPEVQKVDIELLGDY